MTADLFVGGGGSCLVWVVCVCLRIVVSSTYCAVSLFYSYSSMLPFFGLSIFDCPFGILLRLFNQIV